ncbi:PAS domain-containing protein [Gemmatimonas groenlandica]|uniref:histidine kinase n=1 Tax=Gemmatimonas groenlandica TaxID=2732249 RepID=A0A6M4IR38_9BACT|nr:PAS domain-containing protein [Gemmatimonas groenlandica]QJR35947.1 PAS domain-containing protein [Gemmatimonas groenlandica]
MGNTAPSHWRQHICDSECISPIWMSKASRCSGDIPQESQTRNGSRERIVIGAEHGSMNEALSAKSLRRMRAWWIDAATAAGAVAVATMVRFAVDPVLESNYPYLTYFGAVALVAWLGRTASAVLTLAVGAVLSTTLFAPQDASRWLGTGLFLMSASVIVAMSHALRRERVRCEDLLDQSVQREDEMRRLAVAETEQREKLSTTLASIGDAVVTTDAEGRVTLLNAVAEHLTGWTNAEAAGVPLSRVFQIVNEETRLPVESPAMRALNEGVVVGLANHTVLIAKDGTERPIDDSAAPIRGKDGAIVGCVLVFRDISERHAIEAARRDAQEQIAATLESVTDGFIRYDRAWRMVYVNAEAERINRLDRTQMLGGILWELFPAVVGTTLDRELRRAMEERVTVEFENRYEPWGRWYALKAYPMPDGGITTFIRDITEQKAQRDALEASETRFRELADAMPQIVYTNGADGRVDFANRQWLEYTGQADAQTADLSSVVHPDDLTDMLRHWDSAKSTGTALQAEFRLQRAADGEYRWFLTRSVPVRDASGQIVKWFGTSTDIHDQKRVEQQLAESEARYRAIGESIDFGVWVCDATGRNTYASESFLRMVGLTQQQCSDFGWGDVLHPDDAAETIAAWQTCVQTQGTWDRVHRFRGADGRWYSVLARGVPLRSADGDVLGWAGINLDVTRMLQTEHEVERLAAESEQQRRLYETVLTNTPDFVYVFSLDHKVVYANDALIQMWGRGREGAIGKTFLEIGYESWHADMHHREIDQVRATRQPIRGEVPFNGTHGRRQYEYIFVPVLDADGEVEAVAGTTRDITDRLQAEQRLRESEDRQTFLVNLADALRPLADPAAVQSEAARVLGERLGANRVAYFEIRGEHYVIERDYTADVATLAGTYPVSSFGPTLHDTLLTGHTVVETDATIAPGRSADERAAFAAIQVRGHVDVPLVKGGRFVAGMAVQMVEAREWTAQEVAIIEDTAERTWAAVERARVEVALRESEQRFRTLFSTMDEGFCVVEMVFDQDGRAIDYRIEVMNAAFEKHTGMSGLVGKSVREALPTLEEFWYETYGRVATTGIPAEFVHNAAPMDGRWFDVSAFRLGGPGSNKVAILFNDISRRKLAEAEREALVHQLKDRDKRKDEFLATLAHELRNPLAPLYNGLQVIRLAGAEGLVEQARSMMERQLTQMTRLVDDLLDVSRVTTGMLELRRERLELRTVIAAALETSRPLIDQGAHYLVVDLPDEPVFVDGDPVRLAQIVSNLLTNSAKYTNRGGHIRLSVARDNQMGIVSVADDGIGIPEDMLDAVFGMFTQVDRTLEKTTGGLGIGLALVKGLVEMHGGSIEARSAGEGHGSEFVVRLPLAKAASAETVPRREVAHMVDPRRILVVDDNVDSADSLGQVLRLMGHEVRTAYDGEEGIRAAEEFRPSVVLCDIAMPKVNGYDTARHIRAEPWGKHIVLVALSGWSQDNNLQRSATAGFDHHLVKPVEGDALNALLSGLISSAG